MLIKKIKLHTKTIIPGFTHLQAAQPITFAKHLQAYVEMFKRDVTQLHDYRIRLNVSPLGSCALNGTTFNINRNYTAKKLGFNKPTASELSSVSGRDFALEYLANLTICIIHLSRPAEEIILWSSYQFNFIKLSDSYRTGSSIIPQKKNPDGAELIRAKLASIIANLNHLLITMKALPLAYAKDMQKDKIPVFNATDTILLSLKVMTGMINEMRINIKKMKHDVYVGYTNATYLAEWLAQKFNIPFRKAHHITGKIVALAEKKKLSLEALNIKDMQSIEPKITKNVFTFIRRC